VLALLSKKISSDLKSLSDRGKAALLSRFFKTGRGEYGEGDVFYGVTVPQSRSVVKKYWKNSSLADVQKLLNSKFHEARLVAVLILVKKFEEGSEAEKRKVFDFYLANSSGVNNWDLVDSSAHKIVGAFLVSKGKGISLLRKLARSSNLWERRIAIISTFAFIGRGSCKETIEISKILLNDSHDLIHKAVGWALREVGKRCSQTVLEDFLSENASRMPRTMLRYAIERLPLHKRMQYLQKPVK
jgi:3-methyladenine DNA glycosylase AlkD